MAEDLNYFSPDDDQRMSPRNNGSTRTYDDHDIHDMLEPPLSVWGTDDAE